MDATPITIVLISNDAGGRLTRLAIRSGMTVAAFVSGVLKISLDERFVRVNKRTAPLSQVLRDGDVVSVTPTGVRAGAPPMSMRKTKKWMWRKGWKREKNGPGDHEVWKNKNGQRVTLNPKNREKKAVDWASIDQLADAHGLSLQHPMAEIRAV